MTPFKIHGTTLETLTDVQALLDKYLNRNSDVGRWSDRDQVIGLKNEIAERLAEGETEGQVFASLYPVRWYLLKSVIASLSYDRK